MFLGEGWAGHGEEAVVRVSLTGAAARAAAQQPWSAFPAPTPAAPDRGHPEHQRPAAGGAHSDLVQQADDDEDDDDEEEGEGEGGPHSAASPSSPSAAVAAAAAAAQAPEPEQAAVAGPLRGADAYTDGAIGHPAAECAHDMMWQTVASCIGVLLLHAPRRRRRYDARMPRCGRWMTPACLPACRPAPPGCRYWPRLYFWDGTRGAAAVAPCNLSI
jgi:hypothetical protein